MKNLFQMLINKEIWLKKNKKNNIAFSYIFLIRNINSENILLYYVV